MTTERFSADRPYRGVLGVESIANRRRHPYVSACLTGADAMSYGSSTTDVRQFAQIARVFRLAANPARLRVLSALAAGEVDTPRIRELLSDLKPESISGVLDTLHKGGLVKRRSIGNHGLYRLSKAGADVARAFQMMVTHLESASPIHPQQVHPNAEKSVSATELLPGNPAGVLDAKTLLIHAAHPLRLRLLLTLSEGDRVSSQLCDDLGGIGLVLVSVNLGILRSGQLVTSHHFGKQHIYSLTANGLGLVQVVRATCSSLSIRRGELILRPEPIKAGEEGALDPTSPDGLACLLKTFANPVRLRILNLLVASGEICECHLPTVLELPRALISWSLAMPRTNGLVLERRQGQWVFLRAADSASNLHRSLLGCFGLHSPIQRSSTPTGESFKNFHRAQGLSYPAPKKQRRRRQKKAKSDHAPGLARRDMNVCRNQHANSEWMTRTHVGFLGQSRRHRMITSRLTQSQARPAAYERFLWNL